MDKDLIERLANEAGMGHDRMGYPGGEMEDLYRFAALVAEECAKECCNGISTEEAQAAIRSKFKP